MNCGTCGVPLDEHTNAKVILACAAKQQEAVGVWVHPEDNGDGTVTIGTVTVQTHSLRPEDQDWR